MPTGIILKSVSHEVNDEVREQNLKDVVEAAGYEVAAPEVQSEPTREEFKSDEEFEAAHVEWEEKTEEAQGEKPAVSEKEEQSAPARKSRKQRAVDRATENLQKELREAKAKLAEMEGKLPKDEPKQRPKRAEFASDEQYEDALIAWGADKVIADKKLKDAEDANKTRFEENIRNYAAQVEEGKEAHEDWDEVVNQEIFIGKEVQLAILEQENGAEVVYYLGRHPAYAAKLGEMSPLSAVMEVGRLSARLGSAGARSARREANDEEETKLKPRVPAPVRTVNTGGSSGNLTFAEIAAKAPYPGKARDLKIAQAAER